MEHAEALRRLSLDVKQKKEYATNEAATKQFLIDPFFSAMGYNPNEPTHVTPEFRADLYGARAVDYALLKDGQPIILVEFKPAKVALAREHTKQLHAYFSSKLEVRFGIVTNGLEYRFYADLDRPNVMDDDPFLTLNMLQPDDTALETVGYFTRERFDTRKTHAAARKSKARPIVESVVKAELNPLSEDLIDFFIAKIKHRNLKQRPREELAALVKDAWGQLIGTDDVEHSPAQSKPAIEPKPAPPKKPSASTVKKPKAVKPVAAPTGTIAVPVFKVYKGQKLEATLLLDADEVKKSNVRFGGAEYRPSPSTLVAMNTVNPSIENQAHGWRFWRLSDPLDKSDRIADDLRKDDALLQRVLRKYGS